MPVSTLTVPKTALRVLVVDDEESLRHVLGLMLGRVGYEVSSARNGKEALGRLGGVDVVLCDIRMPDMDGLQFLDALPDGAPPVVMMSAYGTVDTALEAMRRGAYDYVSKPFKQDEIVLTLRKVEERERLLTERGALAVENVRLAERAGQPIDGFVSQAPAMKEVLRIASRVAPHDTTVLITGESGTGKEVLARAVHRLSTRAQRPWVAVNCAAIPDNLLESELFGYVRGAFTGADRNHPGLFEQADGGTLFLDEIGDLPLALQGKLLRVLQEGVVRRLGARSDDKVDVRVLAASAQPLLPPRFREDLYYRLAVVHLHLPPLRERSEDIPLLIDHLLDSLAARLRLPRPALDEAARRSLMQSAWPGNVRQLENALERAMVLCDGRVLTSEDLPREVVRPAQVAAEAPLAAGDLSIPRQTVALERRLIEQALRESNGNKAAAARVLEISYKALLYKVREFGLEP